MLICIGLMLIAVNAVAMYHAYRFTHFTNDGGERTKEPERLDRLSKYKVLLAGVHVPRPRNKTVPTGSYTTFTVDVDHEQIECWEFPCKNSLGTILLFPGYTGVKSDLLPVSDSFHALGYTAVIVDFPGHGGSSGNRTTMGYHEAKTVSAVCAHVADVGSNGHIYLYGASMGAVAIMRAVSQGWVQPDGIILECPYGSMLKTVQNRFKLMGVPSIGLSHVLVFWGGVLNGFWAFSNNSVTYASNIHCKALLMYGSDDDRVSESEIMDIYQALAGPKKLIEFPGIGHEQYINKKPTLWKQAVGDFISGGDRTTHP